MQSCGVVWRRGASYCKVPVVCPDNGFSLLPRCNAVLNTSDFFLNLLQPTPPIPESVAPWCTSLHCLVYASLDAIFLQTLGQAESIRQDFLGMPGIPTPCVCHDGASALPVKVASCKSPQNNPHFLCVGYLFNSSFRTLLAFSCFFSWTSSIFNNFLELCQYTLN